MDTYPKELLIHSLSILTIKTKDPENESEQDNNDNNIKYNPTKEEEVY
jgi:hypothetical protein